MSEKETKKAPARKFTKAQLLASKKYRDDVDVLAVMLKDNQTYSLDDAEKAIADFNKRKVN